MLFAFVPRRFIIIVNSFHDMYYMFNSVVKTGFSDLFQRIDFFFFFVLIKKKNLSYSKEVVQ
jgi:transposase